MVNVVPMKPGDKVAAVIDTRDYETYRYLLIATKRGMVKKTAFREYDSSRREGIIALTADDGGTHRLCATDLGRLLGEVERPFLLVTGGAKVEDKLGVLEHLGGRLADVWDRVGLLRAHCDLGGRGDVGRRPFATPRQKGKWT